MGKSVNNHELTAKMCQGIVAALLLLVPLLRVSESRAVSEFELFDRGYEYYLAYQPEKAAETFSLFLKEFPQSSAGDAALFWLGKSLIRVKSTDEARQIFVRLKKEFPESPFVPYAERDLGDLGYTPSTDGARGELVRGEAIRESGGTDSKKEVLLVEHGPVNIMQEGEKLRVLPQEEQTKNAVPKTELMELEKREADRALSAKREVEQKSIAADGSIEKEIIREARQETGEMKGDLSEQTTPKVSEDREKQKVGLLEEGKKAGEVKAATTERGKDAAAKKLPGPDLMPKRDGPFTVQVGALSNQKAANRLRIKLERKGYKAAVKGTTSDGNRLFRVTTGKFDTKKDAEAFAAKLRKAIGLNVFPVETGPAEGEYEVQLRAKTQPGMGEERDKTSSPQGEKKEAEQMKLTAKREEESKKEQPSGVPGAAKTEIASEAKPAGEVEKAGSVRVEGRPPPDSVRAGAQRAGDAKYTVQVGAFSNRKTANRVKAKCDQKDYRATVNKIVSKGGTLYRVTVGMFDTKRDAEKYSLKLKKATGMYAFPVEMERVTTEKEPLAEKGSVKSGGKTLHSGVPSGEVVVKTEEAEKGGQEPEKPHGFVKSKRGEPPWVTIKGKEFGSQEISGFTESFSAALAKAGIKEVPWRSGNAFEDFVNEQILFEVAKESGIVVDADRLGELREKYSLVAEEADYVERYLAVSGLVQRRMESAYEERLLESLVVTYEETGNQEKAVLASMLQEHARNGEPFKELAGLYPSIVRFSMIRLRDLQGLVKDSVWRLKDGEISVVWTRGGFMILKPVESKPVSGMTGRLEGGNDVKVFVKEWLEELKKDKKVEIVYE